VTGGGEVESRGRGERERGNEKGKNLKERKRSFERRRKVVRYKG